jgi:protein gp37
MKNSTIEWCDHTFNPWTGCSPVSEGCTNCYAATMAARGLPALNGLAEFRGSGAKRRAVFTGEVRRTSASYWKQPLAWNKEAVAKLSAWKVGITHIADGERDAIARGFVKPERPRVFCASMSDVLHRSVPVPWLADLLELIRLTPNLDWLLLSKRPEDFFNRISAVELFMAEKSGGRGSPRWLGEWIKEAVALPNVWIGTSVEDQAAADARIPHLLKIPARVRFLSCEPLLGAVKLSPDRDALGRPTLWGPLKPEPQAMGESPRIHWVIAGGESGPRARPMHPNWARGLRDQCVAAGVPFLFKQWGEWCEDGQAGFVGGGVPSGVRNLGRDGVDNSTRDVWPVGNATMMRYGKKVAGRLLDGREWSQFPEAGKS